MGKVERKIRQTLRREARHDFDMIAEGVVRNKPWYVPLFLWTKIVDAVLNSRVNNLRQGKN